MKSLLTLPNDSTLKTILVALLLCLVCSVLISTAAVSLKPLQLANKDLDRKKNILEVTKLMKPGGDIAQLFKQIESKVVNLSTGEYVDSIDPNQYDQRQAAKDPNQNLVISPQQDLAQIKQRAKNATVYLVRQDDQIQYFVLPVHGYGLWSTLYGFLVLKGDANTIFGLQFYEHRETPGLGGEVDNPKWRKKWKGKLIYDKAGAPRIQLIKGAVEANDPKKQFHVDGLSGATLTANGVTKMLQYWLGQDGFGPYLQKYKNKV